MLAVLSPSKTLDFKPISPPGALTQPAFLKDTKALVAQMKDITPARLKKLMEISDKLAQLNAERFRSFHFPFTEENAKPALYAFKGDVYAPLTLDEYSKKDVAFANEHLRILSGLYGLLKPLDLIQPYRLEMGIPLKNKRGKDLYAFWGARITDAINAALKSHSQPILLNLASQEYFKAVQPAQLQGQVVQVNFLDQKGTSAPKIIGLFAKKARGMMADFIVRGHIDRLEGVKAFKAEGYRFTPALSDEESITFLRRH